MKQSTAWLVTCAMGASMVLAFAAVIGGDNIEAVLNLGRPTQAGSAAPEPTREAGKHETKGEITDETTGSSTVGARTGSEPPKAASETQTVQVEREPTRPTEPARPMPRVESAPPEAPARSEPPALPERQALPDQPEPAESKSKSASESQPAHAGREPARQDEPAPPVTQAERVPPEAPASAEQQSLPGQPESAESKSNSASESPPAHAGREPARQDESAPPVTQAERVPPEAPASAEQQPQPSQRELPESKVASEPKFLPAEREPARQDEPAPPVTQAERAPPEAPASPEPQTVLREPAPPEAKAEPTSENPKIDTHEPSTREVSTPAPAEILPAPEARSATPSERGAALQQPATEVRPADARKLRAAKRNKKSFKQKANRNHAYRRAYARARPPEPRVFAAPPYYHRWGASPRGPRRCGIAYVPYGETWHRVRICP